MLVVPLTSLIIPCVPAAVPLPRHLDVLGVIVGVDAEVGAEGVVIGAVQAVRAGGAGRARGGGAGKPPPCEKIWL